jgi:hypothetical protein
MKTSFCLSLLIMVTSMNGLRAQHFEWSTSGGYVGVPNAFSGATDIARDPAGNLYLFNDGNLAQQCQGDTVQTVTGPFVPMFPTFNTYNSITALEEENVGGNQMTLFPNPSTGDFFISLNSESSDPAYLEIFDPGGRKVWQQPVGSGKSRISTTLASGVYFCRVEMGNEKFPVQKLMVR